MNAVERLPLESLSLARDHVVLCVDDELETLHALRRALRREPYDLMTTVSPDQALRWVEDQDVSLVISDQKMPLMVGTELLRGVRKRSPTTVCVVLTAFPGSVLVGGQPSCGVRELILKPWEDQNLRNVVLQLLRERESEMGRTDPEEPFDLGGEGGAA